MKRVLIIVWAILLTTSTACGTQLTEPTPEKNTGDRAQIMEQQSSEVVKSRMNFAFSLYPQVIKEQDNEDVLISPVSIMLALMMAYNGAEGETQVAMATALESTGVSLEDLNRDNQLWIQSMEQSDADENVLLQIANSLWGREGIHFEDKFKNNLHEFYDAEVHSLDFDKPEAPDTINQWVSKQTNDKITKIIGDSINEDTILFLINAIYFNGKWEKPFEQKLTEKDTFNLASNTTKQHPFMNQSGKFNYVQMEQFQAVQLPYGDGATSMYVFLPDESSSLQEFQAELNSTNWTKWLSSFKKQEGHVALPKFKVEYELELKKALTAMGMGITFQENQANFMNMVVDKSYDPYISSVKHKTYMDVHEEGTEAAAVTSIEVSTTSLDTSKPEPFEMKINRPFFIVINDDQTDTILFMGSIYDPEL